jgi:hypothetical protein
LPSYAVTALQLDIGEGLWFDSHNQSGKITLRVDPDYIRNEVRYIYQSDLFSQLKSMLEAGQLNHVIQKYIDGYTNKMISDIVDRAFDSKIQELTKIRDSSVAQVGVMILDHEKSFKDTIKKEVNESLSKLTKPT